MTHTEGNTLCFGIHKLINCICNRKELSEQWKETIIVPTYKKGDKTDCSNYKETSLLYPQIMFTGIKVIENSLNHSCLLKGDVYHTQSTIWYMKF
jgi:hypothetical protein